MYKSKLIFLIAAIGWLLATILFIVDPTAEGLPTYVYTLLLSIIHFTMFFSKEIK